MGLERDTHLGSALLDMYAKCDLLDDARALFHKLPEADVVSWTALITGCVEHGYVDRALECYEEMKNAGVVTNPKALVSILKAYSNIGSIENTQEVHCEIIGKGWEGDIVAASTLAHAYAKCGSCEEAKHVFDELPARDDVCWNVVLAAYAQAGESWYVLRLLDAMLEERRKPDLVAFIGVLNACSHGGEVGKGERCFAAIGEYDLLPKAEHYACVIDLLGRSGCIDKMIRMLNDIPVLPDKMMWLAMLGACRKWGFVESGRCAFEHAVELDARDGSAYICMANIYSEAKLQEEAMRVETMGVANEAWLKSGQNAADIPLQCLAFLLE
jgi:pentatricopeptide repeat protein